MKQVIKQVLVSIMIFSFFSVASFANTSENSSALTEEQLSEVVKELVKENNNANQPIIYNSNLVDPIDGSKISFYIIPQNQQLVTSSTLNEDGGFTIQSSTTITSHTINQGVKMYYYNSNGEPWQVDTSTLVTLSFRTNQSTSTYMKYGHINSDTNTEVISYSSYGPSKYSYTTSARATHIHFFIENKSSTSVVVSGSITF